MNTPPDFSSTRLTLVAFVMAVCIHGVPASAAVTATAVVESKLQGGTILAAPAGDLAPTVRDCVRENSHRAPSIVEAVLAGGRADADALAPQITVAAIQGLGEKPSKYSIASIVYAAVKATPAVVLEIVRAAVKASPKEAAQGIVAAAVQAVPNPHENIRPLNSTAESGFSKDGKDGAAEENPLPIGEAIADAAKQADPSLSTEELTNTVNRAIAESKVAATAQVKSAYFGYYYPPLVVSAPASSIPQPPAVSK